MAGIIVIMTGSTSDMAGSIVMTGSRITGYDKQEVDRRWKMSIIFTPVMNIHHIMIMVCVFAG